MDKQDYLKHRFQRYEAIMHKGEPAEIIQAGDDSALIRIGANHYKMVLPADIELKKEEAGDRPAEG